MISAYFCRRRLMFVVGVGAEFDDGQPPHVYYEFVPIDGDVYGGLGRAVAMMRKLYEAYAALAVREAA